MTNPERPVDRIKSRPVPRDFNEKLRLGQRTKSFTDTYEKKHKPEWLPHPDLLEWPASLSSNRDKKHKAVPRNHALTMAVNLRSGKQDDGISYRKSTLQRSAVSFLCDLSPYFRELVEVKGVTS